MRVQTNSTPEIRLAREQDLNLLLELEIESFSGDRLSQRRLRHWITANNALLLCAFSSGNLAGCLLIIFRQNSRRARAYSLAVAKDYQRRGIAESLITEAYRRLMEIGRYQQIYLEVRQDNLAGIRLYEKLGFRQQTHLTGFYQDGSDAIRMEREL